MHITSPTLPVALRQAPEPGLAELGLELHLLAAAGSGTRRPPGGL